MTEWARAIIPLRCGFCPQRTVAIGEPILIHRLPGVKKPRIRCQDCAGPAPPDLPLNIVTNELPEDTTQHWQPVADAAREWMPYKESE